MQCSVLSVLCTARQVMRIASPLKLYIYVPWSAMCISTLLMAYIPLCAALWSHPIVHYYVWQLATKSVTVLARFNCSALYVPAKYFWYPFQSSSDSNNCGHWFHGTTARNINLSREYHSNFTSLIPCKEAWRIHTGQTTRYYLFQLPRYWSTAKLNEEGNSTPYNVMVSENSLQ